ncbi:MAG TPA: glycine--tRNA ligase subunit beta [Tissierellaceae bacterium]
MSKNYLLEIGSEEIPARYVKNALDQIENKFRNLLKEEKIEYEDIKVYSTPRRLTTIITGLSEKQKDEELEVRGPSKKIAFDEDNNPTKALEGFMRGQSVTLENIVLKNIKDEEYVFAQVYKKGKTIDEVLKENLSALIKSIRFPESMKWGGKDLRFIRPIRWIVSVLDEDILYFDFEGIKVSNETNGHRFLGEKNIVVTANNYEEKLRENFVILDSEERKETILYESSRLARSKGGNIGEDEALLDEVTNLVEYPTPIIGRIKDEYLKLPDDVIITPMKEHLRYFPVFDDKDRLLPYFITVRNGDDKHLETVVKGNEKVLGARLEDAKFFFEDDISVPLEDYVENLKNITFQEKLGTIYDKTVRIQKLSEKICEYLEVGEETTNDVLRAAYLSKADLTTKMVVEFTELQGKMGMEYAKIAGEDDIVSQAIYEQYLPRFSGDKLPQTTAGAILGISDKLDSIAGLFAIGIHPTGSQDPFALRRSAIGIINIILDRKLHLSLDELIDFSLYIYVDDAGLAFDYNKVKEEIKEFLLGRAKNMFLDEGIRYDVIDAVLKIDSDDLFDIKIRIDKLNEWIKKDGINEVLEGFNRVASLAVKSDNDQVYRDLMNDYETDLYDSYNEIEEDVLKLIKKRDYDEALDLFATLKKPIDNFFNNVMVMVEDEKLKENRLGLLRKIYNTMIKVCDLSQIVK